MRRDYLGLIGLILVFAAIALVVTQFDIIVECLSRLMVEQMDSMMEQLLR